jgi:thiol-disulfide isomerase/thioredoxin
MKNIFLSYSLLVLFMVSCQGSGGLRIKGTTDIENGSNLYHIVADANNQPKVLDTLVVKDGQFSLQAENEAPSIHFLQIEGRQDNFPFVAEKGTVSIELYKDSLGASKATGTVSNDDFMKYKSETQVYITSLNAIGNDLQQATILQDSLLAEDLKDQYQDVRDQIQEYELNFIKSAPNSFISILILERFVANSILQLQEAKELYDGFSDRIKNTPSGRAIGERLNQAPKAEVGQLAPFFEGPDPNGGRFNLADRLGKVTIIDFWASWCRPCRVENPNLVRLYNKHKGNGLQIVGVSLDRTKPKWVQAIADDGLVWEHVSNLKFWNDPIAKMYQVSAIPATFILDENGVIITRDLRGPMLERKIDELLGSL